MARQFRIHPSMGVARVGNSPDEFFVGPEQPSVPANWENGAFGSFRDQSGRIKRQAARFRVFEYVDDGSGGLRPVEVAIGDDVIDIEWRVHIANRKGSFFTFNGQSGAADLYDARAAKAPDAPEKEDEEAPRVNLRNAAVPSEQRIELDLDPGEKVVSRAAAAPVVLTNTNQKVSFIPDLGEIRMDEAGRLLVLGGHGRAGSTANVVINEYANNDTWFDDVGDGPVKARVRLADGSVVDADAAWVIVGPPDFVPTVPNAVTLYDLMWDLAVRQLPVPAGQTFRAGELADLLQQKKVWIGNDGRSLDGYTPSFLREIYPILSRALAVRQLHEPFEIDKQSYHLQLMNWAQLASQDTTDPLRDPAALREYVIGKIRDPNSDRIDWTGMPRGLGDDYDSLDSDEPKPTGLFSLTRIQFALLEQWAKGVFVNDWPGSEPGVPEPAAVTPAGLDRAGLENCVGGPFFPGIEVGWLIRRTELYGEPFRLDIPRSPLDESGPPKRLGALVFGSGFFSQQMAQPWHADFYDCHKEVNGQDDARPYYYMWWTAQRPDDTFAPNADTQRPWVRHLIGPDDLPVDELEVSNERFKKMVANWANLPFVLPNADGDLREEPR